MAHGKPDNRFEFLFQENSAGNREARYGRPVECLGLRFDDDESRRKYFLGKLKEGLEELHERLGGIPFIGVDDAVVRMTAVEHWPMGDPARLHDLAEHMYHADSSKDLLQRWKNAVGFPHGEIKNILKLSDPPYFTACPNPFIRDFIIHHGNDRVVPVDVCRRKHPAPDERADTYDPDYNPRSCRSKVLPNARLLSLARCAKPGDVIFGGICGNRLEEIGAVSSATYGGGEFCPASINPNGRHWQILANLSPLATFVTNNLCRPVCPQAVKKGIESVYAAVDAKTDFLFVTRHSGWKARDKKFVGHNVYHRNETTQGSVEFTVYSDVVRCPECGIETTLYVMPTDESNGSLQSKRACSNCEASVAVSQWEPVFATLYDPVLNQEIKQQRIEPILINYKVGSTRFEKFPDEDDRRLLNESFRLLDNRSLPGVRTIAGKETRRNESLGVTHLHHFFTPREHLIVASILDEIQKYPDNNVRRVLLIALVETLPYVSRMRRFRADRKGGRPLPETHRTSSLIAPPHVLKLFRRNALILRKILVQPKDSQQNHIVSTQNAMHVNFIPSESMEYIFVNSLFGKKFDCSKFNFFWEGILGLTSNQILEATMDMPQFRGIQDCREIVTGRFSEFYRILKPGKWVAIEFSDIKASFGNAIQSALELSGFVVANVPSFGGKEHFFKTVTTPKKIKRGLVVFAYKPGRGLEERFGLEAGTENGVWDFVGAHLAQLPVFVAEAHEVEVINERQKFLLFDRMVSFHIQRGATVPMSAAEFYSGLAQRFPERDGMYFLPDQVVRYDRRRMYVGGVRHPNIFVVDETSAIQWLSRELGRKPQIFQDIHSKFIRDIATRRKYEDLPTLFEMLEQNFLRYNGVGKTPSQIHTYLLVSFKELRKLASEHPALRAKAKNRWYVPDTSKAADMELRRTRILLCKFDEYRQSSQCSLKFFSHEAMRAGFFKAYQDRDYGTIIEVAGKIPRIALQNDPKLLFWYDLALMRMGKA